MRLTPARAASAALLLGTLACGRADAPSSDGPGAARPAATSAELGRIVADSFTLVVHGAERFVPPAASLWKPAPDREYVALDVALLNPTADSIALGWVTLAPALVDASGARHPFLPALVAAFQMEAPSGARFDSAAYERLLGGRLAAGDSVRAWAWAFEVPRGAPLELELVSGETRYRAPIAR